MSLGEYLPVMPVASPDDACIASRRGDITFAWRVVLPVAYTVNEAGYDGIVASFMQACRLLPEYCVVHKQDVFRMNVCRTGGGGGFLMDSFNRHYDGFPYLDGVSYLFLTFSSRSVVESGTSSPGHFAGVRPPSREHILSCASIAAQFASVLSSNPLLSLEELRGYDFLHTGDDGYDAGLIAEYLRFWQSAGPDYDLEMSGSCVRCGDLVSAAWYVEDSDAMPSRVASVRGVTDMSVGGAQVFLSGGSPFGYSLRIPHCVNRYLVILPRCSVEAELGQRKRLMTSFSAYSAHSRVNAEELDAYLDESARSALTTVRCFTDVIAWGTLSQMQDIRGAVVTAFSDLGIAVTEERRFMPHLHYAGIPGAAAELGWDYYMTSELTAFLCQGLWDGHDAGMPRGALSLCDRRRMTPVRLDFQEEAQRLGLVNNYNMLVVGPSGSGKSFTMNHIVNCLYCAGQYGLVIDVGDSYEGLFRVVREETGGRDGIYNTYDPDHPLSFNPFRGRRHWDEVDEDGERISSGLDFVLSLLQTMYEPAGGWTRQGTGVLEALLRRFFELWDNGWDEELETSLRTAHVNAARVRWTRNGGSRSSFDASAATAAWRNPLPEIFSRGGDPIFDDFYRYVSLVASRQVAEGTFLIDGIAVKPESIGMDNFCIALSKYGLNGQYGFLLNAGEEKDIFSGRLTCYEVDRIRDNADLMPLWLLSIMHSFEEKMRTLECPKFIVIEEAWSAIARPSMAGFIVWLWRTARKFRTSAIVVTQSVDDLVASPVIKDAIILNTSTKILLDQSSVANRFASTAELLGLSPMEVGLVLSVGRGLLPEYGPYKEVFVSVGGVYSNVYALRVSPEQALAYESVKARKAPLLRLADARGSLVEAIRETVSGRRKDGINN